MKKTLLLYLIIFPFFAFGQQTLTLENCYDLATKNYPTAKQNDLLSKKASLDIEALNTGKLPKIDLNAQATYQSEVTQLPIKIPNLTVTPPNKDQYKATLDVQQLIYNGGLIQANTDIKKAQTKTQQQQLEVSLYQLKPRINQLYFSVLLLQEKQQILKAKQDQLLAKIKEIKTAVKFGALLPSSEQVVEAENLKIKQQLIEIDYDRKKGLENLASLTYSTIDKNTILTSPSIKINSIEENNRPELKLFDFQTEQLTVTKNGITKNNLPKVNAFGQAGYGNPGLNMLDNSFQPFYMVGVKANWNVFDWNKSKTEKQALTISESIIASEKETFLLNTQLQLQEIDSDSNKLIDLIETDKEIIQLRESILKTTDAQLRNGVITSAEYLIEITNLFEAKTLQKTHEIQLALAKANYKLVKG